jgi:hypothetical protein
MRRTLVAALLLSALPARAENPPLEEAKAYLDKLEYTEAARALDLALELSGNDRETLLSIYELRGVIAGFLKDPEHATEAFRVMLAMDPKRKLRAKYPPRVTTPFFEAKGWVAEHGALTMTREPPVDHDGRIERIGVSVTDPLQIATAVRFSWSADGESHTSVVVLKATGAALPVSGVQVKWYAALLALRDGVLLELGSEAQPLDEEAKTRPPVKPVERQPEPQPPPVVERPLLPAPAVVEPAPPVTIVAKPPPPQRTRFWVPSAVALGVGLIAAAAGIPFGAQSAADYAAFDSIMTTDTFANDWTRQRALDTIGRAKSSAMTANVLFACGGAVALAAGIALIVDLLLGDGT